MAPTQKTYSPKASEVTHAWRLVDADGQTLGRLASQVATFLRGKHRPTFCRTHGHGRLRRDRQRRRASGSRATRRSDRFYYRHSTYPGGLNQVALGEVLEKHPDRVIKHSVKGMLPHNALGRKMLRKLKVYAGPNHPHEAQFRASEQTESRA